MTDQPPVVLSAEARRMLVFLAKWSPADEGGPYQLSAESVPAAAELLKAGQIRLRDYKGRIEVELVR